MKVTGVLGIWSHLVCSGTDRQYYRLVHKDNYVTVKGKTEYRSNGKNARIMNS